MITEIENLQPANVLEMRWALTNLCNYKCRYCFPGSNEGNYRFPNNTSALIKSFNHIFDYYKKHQGKDRFNLRLLGGEPTLWPELDFFIKGIKEHHNVYLSVITNASRTLRWWQENGYLIDNLCISYHKKFADVNHIINVADTMYMFDKKVTVHVLMDPDEWDGCVADIEYMKKNSRYPWLIETKKLTPTSLYTPTYTEKQNKYMKWGIKRIPSLLWFIKQFKLVLDKSIRLYESKYTKDGKTYRARAQTYIVNNETNFCGYECNSGVENLYINWDGSVIAGCFQSVFDEPVNINNDLSNFSPDPKPIICKRDNCWCAADNHISKKYIKIYPV